MSGTKLVKNTGFYLIATYFPYLVSFITLPLYTRFLSKEDYAVLALAQSFIAFLPLLMTLQLHSSIYRFFIDFKDKDLKVFITTIFIFLTFTSTCASFVLFQFLPDILNKVFPNIKDEHFTIFYISTVIAVLNIYQGLNMAVIRMREEAKKFMFISLFLLIFSVLTTIVEVVILEKGIYGMIEAMLIASIASFLVYTFINKSYFTFAFKLKYIKAPLLFSLPLIVNSLSSYVFMYSDRIILEKYVPVYLTLGTIGLYALADKIAFLFKAFVNQVLSAFQPHFFKQFKVDESKAKQECYKASEVVFLIITIGITVAALFSKEIVEIIFTKNYHGVWPMIPLLSTCFFFRALYSFSNLGIVYRKKTIYTTITTFISAFVNVILNLLLIPHFGVYGAVYATMASFFTSFIIIRILSKKIEPIPINIKFTITCMVLIFSSILGVWLLHNWLDHLLKICLVKIGFLGLVLFTIYKTEIVTKQQVLTVFKKR